MRKFGANGFTLMEVMITVVIIGILAAIAYPSYTRYVNDSRRTPAWTSLTALAAQQEKFFTQCGGYAGNVGATPPGRVCPAVGNPASGVIAASTVPLNSDGTTLEGHYLITIAPIPGGTLASSYLLTATPIGVQLANDGGPTGRCSTIGLDSTGLKSATGTDALIGSNPGGKCWKK